MRTLLTGKRGLRFVEGEITGGEKRTVRASVAQPARTG
jgi:hypothetical protein